VHALRAALNHYEPPASNSLPVRMGIIVARIDALTVRSTMHDGAS